MELWVTTGLRRSHLSSDRFKIKRHRTRSTIGEGRGCNKFVPVLGGNDTKIVPVGDVFDQTPGQM